MRWNVVGWQNISFVVIFITVLAILIWGWVKIQEKWGIYHPERFSSDWFGTLPAGLEAVSFETEDGIELTGVFKEVDPEAPTVILAHGNSGDLRGRLVWFDLVVPAGWNGFIFDYRGYGTSEGKPSEAGLYTDMAAAIDFASERAAEDKIYLHGRSLGVPVAANGASKRPVKGIVLESGLPSAADAATTILPLPGVGGLLSVDFATLEYLKEATKNYGPLPKIIIHGTEDKILPFWLGEKLYKKSPPPKTTWVVEEAGHNNLIETAGEKVYSQRIKGFLESIKQDRMVNDFKNRENRD
ncbi:MAG: alpha/beta hydrolase [bacterium]